MRWALRSANESVVAELAASGISPLIARLLATRGITAADAAGRFLKPSLGHLHSPYLMRGMNAAVERLRAAIERREKVLIYGDYDVDGTTAIVVLKTAIELCGGRADFHVPHRILEGYGMRDEVIERAAADGVHLIISVDTGIRAFAAAETARRVGVDLIVTDHHLAHVEGVPQALAVLNPNQPGCDYPCKALCGAGVAFKLAQALLECNDRARLIPSFLKIVAIATVADAVPLTGENRVFASIGLEGLRSAVNPGLKALLEVSALDGGRSITAGDVAFRIAPRLNAAGRMDVARDVIDLFTVRDPERAREIAVRLNQLNGDRQQEEQRIIAEIDAQIADDPRFREAYCMVLAGEGWHRGVIGIAATRVVERYGRPALVGSRDGEEAHGSGRSIEGFHLLNALESCGELFTRFGGHAHAVGFSLPSSLIPELQARVDAYARSCLTLADFDPVLHVEAAVELDQITPELFDSLCRLEPFGMGNPRPVFSASGVRLLAPARIMKDRHVKLRFLAGTGSNGNPRPLDAIGWRMAERIQASPLLAGDLLDIAFTIEENSHPDFGGLQLCLEDFARPQAASAGA